MANVRERRPGVWEIRAYAGTDPVTGKPRWRWATYYAERREPGAGKRGAERAQRALQAEVDAEKPGTTLTLGCYLDDWLTTVAPRLAPTTVRAYRTKVRGIQAGPLGKIPLDKLRPVDFDHWYSFLLGRATPVTVQGYHRVLRAALRQAERWGHITANPIRHVTPPSVPPRDLDPPTPEDVAQLVRSGGDLGPLILFACLTGLRRGELCGLRWSAVDFEGRILTVRESVWQGEGTWGIKRPKSGRSRMIALDPGTLRILTERLAVVSERAERLGVPLTPDQFVWGKGDGTPLLPDSLSHAFAKVAISVFGPGRFRWHDLRHFSATQLIAAGFDPVTVAQRLGHADPAVTLRFSASCTGSVYGKLTQCASSSERKCYLARARGGLAPVTPSVQTYAMRTTSNKRSGKRDEGLPLGVALKLRRDELGLLQREAAQRLETTPATYSRWEAGLIVPSPEHVGDLAEFLGVTPEEAAEMCGRALLKRWETLLRVRTEAAEAARASASATPRRQPAPPARSQSKRAGR